MFWTKRIPNGVTVDLEAGSASMKANNLKVVDSESVFQALFGPDPKIPAKASFDIRWSGVKERFSAHDVINRYEGEYVENSGGSIEWSASNASGFTFVANVLPNGDPAGQTFEFGELGHEHNGVFFNHG